jgi:hypothetical protein
MRLVALYFLMIVSLILCGISAVLSLTSLEFARLAIFLGGYIKKLLR